MESMRIMIDPPEQRRHACALIRTGRPRSQGAQAVTLDALHSLPPTGMERGRGSTLFPHFVEELHPKFQELQPRSCIARAVDLETVHDGTCPVPQGNRDTRQLHRGLSLFVIGVLMAIENCTNLAMDGAGDATGQASAGPAAPIGVSRIALASNFSGERRHT